MEWYMEAWRNTFDFSGRATRSEYWWFYFVNSAIMFVLFFAIMAYFAYYFVGNPQYNDYEPRSLILLFMAGIMIFFTIVTTVPTLSVSVRRLHDVGMSGWWMFILFVPVIGPLYLIYKFCCDSELGENDFGPNPKGEHGYNMDVFDEIE